MTWKKKKIIKKICFLAGLFMMASPSFLSADSGLLFGQKHYYSVIFRGNGEAIVYAKMVVTNGNDTPLSKLSVEVPDVKAEEFSVVQQQLPPKCKQQDIYGACLEYTDPDYDSYYYSSYGNGAGGTYQKVALESNNGVYDIALPVPIDPQKSGAVIITYSARGYVKNQFGLNRFKFNTLKVPARISNIKVSVDVDSDLLMKGKKSNVNYSSLGVQEFSSTANSLPSGSISMDKLSSRIGSDGVITKEARNLSPNETFTVSGEYAGSWLRLYLGSIILAIIIFIVIFLIIYLFHRRQKKKDIIANIVHDNPSSPSEINITLKDTPWTKSALITFITALLITALTFGLQKLFDSEIINALDFGPLVGIIGIIAIVILYLMVVFGPIVMLSSGKGWKSFIISLAFEFLWLVIIIFTFIALFPSS